MIEHAVVIAGGGPTGLMLGAELTLAGADVVVVERRPDQRLDGSRAGGLHPRTIEVLDQRGVAERFLDAGEAMQVTGFGGIRLDISDFPTRYAHGLALWQNEIERLLAEWVDELGVRIVRETDVTGLVREADGVVVALSGDRTIRAEYLVGCDGGRSVVRKQAGIDFVGFDPSVRWIIAEAEMDAPTLGPHPDGGGIGPVTIGSDEGPYRMVLVEGGEVTGEATLDDARAALIAAYGTDFGVRDATWVSRFSDMSRQAATYRSGRVLVAGDAAHVHAPTGGQGLNVGVQDAVNLGWKLALVVAGHAPDSLLDSYHDERHPVGARVLHNTMAQVALTTAGERHQALRDTMSDLLEMDGPRRHLAGMISGLDVHYDLGDRHPLVGRRMPDLDLRTGEGDLRTYELLHGARPVLVDLRSTGTADVGEWSGRVELIEASTDGPWELPVIGPVDAPPAVLIRPDGHVAWVGEVTDPGLRDAMVTWFGDPNRPLVTTRRQS